MKKILIFTCFAAFIFACAEADEGEKTAATTPKKSAAALPDGEKLYKQHCITCHGLYGDMGASGAANLKSSELSLDERIAVVTNGRPGTTMVAFTTLLKEDQIKAVSEYTMKLSSGS